MNGDDPQRTLRGEEQEVTPPTLTLSGGDASSLLLGWGGVPPQRDLDANIPCQVQ